MRNAGYFNAGSLIVGLVVPFVAVVGGVAVLGRSEALVLGIPVVFAWVFAWFVLTSACLAVSWYVFDREYYEGEEGEKGRESGPEPGREGES